MMRFSKRIKKAVKCLLAVLLFAACLNQVYIPAVAEGIQALDSRTLSEINKPGVVMIQTINRAQISVPEVDISEEGNKTLGEIVQQRILDGEVEYSEAAAIQAVLEEFLKNPAAYIAPTGNTFTKEAEASSIGTGFIVTPDGYIVTNAHVVYTPEEALKRQLATYALDEMISKGVNEFFADLKTTGYQANDDDVKRLQDAYLIWYINNMQISDVKTEIYSGIGMVIPGVETISKGFVCDLRKRGEPSPGKDVAILKIDRQNLPTVNLGDDKQMQSGDKVYAIGYPGAATFNPMLDQSKSMLESTFTEGVVSAKKAMPGGWEVLQMDAAITHGNSGGPVFNDQGEVIGIATFGSMDFSTGQEIQGLNFAIPIGIAKQFLNEINVQPAESTLTKDFREALSLAKQEKYKKSLTLFKEINDVNPGYPYIQDQIAKCTAAVSAGKDKSVNSMLFIYIGGGVLLIVVLLLVIIFIVKSGSKKKTLMTQPQYYYPPEKQQYPPQDQFYSQQNRQNIPPSQPYQNAAGQQHTSKPVQTVDDAPVFCSDCGKQCSPGGKFCDRCGKRLS
jgi:serine protease Do